MKKIRLTKGNPLPKLGEPVYEGLKKVFIGKVSEVKEKKGFFEVVVR